MAICPFAVQKPVAAHGGRIGTILGVVEHVTAGTGDPYNEFANPANQVSSHFGIGNGRGGMADGAIEQYVDTGDESWAQAAGNASYLSIETEGQPGSAMTNAQVAAFGGLVAWMHETHGIPLAITDSVGQEGLIAHGDGGALWGGHIDCPGTLRKAQRPAILSAAAADLQPTQGPPPNPPTTGDKTMTCDRPGGGVYVVRADGTVDCFDGAPMFGSLPGLGVKPAAPIIGICATPTGMGYWLLGADGGIFCFGDAQYYGPLPKYLTAWGIGQGRPVPLVGLVRSGVAGVGYTLVADGGGAAAALYGITTDSQYAK